MPMMVPDVAEIIGAAMHDDVVTDTPPGPTTVRDQLAAGRRRALRLTAAPCRRTSRERSDESAGPSSPSTGPEIPRWLWAAFRFPERLYRFGLGSLLGRRFLRLSHRGRRSGAPYATVLEVVAYDGRIPEFVVASGFGARADWLRNIEAGGPVEVTVGRRTFPVEHRRLELDEAVCVFADYERRNRAAGPILRRVLSWLLGWRYDGTPDARRRMAEQLPLIAFRPRTS